MDTSYKPKNILILGKGYIGNYLTDHFLKSKNGIYKINHLSKSTVDYTNPLKLKTFLDFLEKTDEENPVQWVINTSGFTGTPNVDGCEDHKDDCYFYNVTAPLYMTKVCNDFNIPIIHIGSGCVYSGYDKIYTEDDPTDFGVDCEFSSTYSKTKDAFEKLSRDMQRAIFRIRIPFNGVYEPKNYLYKICKYDNLISKQNSITCVHDLVIFIEKFINTMNKNNYQGIYNVVNKGSIDCATVVDTLRAFDINNPNWKFVTIKEANFKVARSNCILSTKKIESLGLGLPDVNESLLYAISHLSLNYKYNNGQPV
jgi:dTDP-4-dehydrorhamnose reductase